MRRLFALILVLLLMLSLVGCDKFDIEFPLGKVEEPVMDKTTGERETEPTQPPIPQVTVSDAYSDTLYYGETLCCYHIPRFDIESPETESLNRAIYIELYDMLEQDVYAYPEQPFLFEMSYRWVQVENIVSLLVYVQADWGMRIFRVYHAYADGSGVVSREALLEHLGYTQSEFYDLATRKLEEKYFSLYSGYPGEEDDPFYQEQLEKTVSYDNVTQVIPFISSNGDLCCVATIYSLAGADAYDYVVNLTGSGDVPLPSCTDHS